MSPENTTDAAAPRVVIGIPTYRRPVLLRRAIESALRQTYANVTVLVCDNASPDDTEEVCRRYAASDARLRYFRLPENLGAIGNFRKVLALADAPLFMWLSDDDWIPDDFVDRCVAVLREDPAVALAGARAAYIGHEGPPTGAMVNCTSSRPVARVLSYYRQVDDNAIFYGVMRREQVGRIFMNSWIASDWLIVAALAHQGKLRTIEALVIHREPDGASSDRRKMAASMGVPAWQARVPVTVAVMVNAAVDAVRNPAFAQEPLWWRLGLAAMLPPWIAVFKPVQAIRLRLRARRA